MPTNQSTMMVVGVDPSLTGFGVSDGVRAERYETGPIDGEDPAYGLRRRCTRLVVCLNDFVCTGASTLGPLAVYMEAAMLTAQGEGANHLYEVGWLYAHIYDWACARSQQTTIVLVPNGRVLKFVMGKGVATKTELALKVYKRWKCEFDKDPKHDKLFAYCLWRYGTDVERGAYEHIAVARRGRGTRTKV